MLDGTKVCGVDDESHDCDQVQEQREECDPELHAMRVREEADDREADDGGCDDEDGSRWNKVEGKSDRKNSSNRESNVQAEKPPSN